MYRRTDSERISLGVVRGELILLLVLDDGLLHLHLLVLVLIGLSRLLLLLLDPATALALGGAAGSLGYSGGALLGRGGGSARGDASVGRDTKLALNLAEADLRFKCQ